MLGIREGLSGGRVGVTEEDYIGWEIRGGLIGEAGGGTLAESVGTHFANASIGQYKHHFLPQVHQCT